VPDFLNEIRAVTRAAGFEEQIFARIGEMELPAFRRAGKGGPLLYVSSGVHGDEPAGPLALLEAFREEDFGTHFEWLILPIINPTGLAAGTRETADGIDLNRDYKFLRAPESREHRAFLERNCVEIEAALGLHEDWEAAGAYLYEHNPDGKAHPCEALLESLATTIGLQPGAVIDGWPTVREGLIHPQSDPDLRDYWPEQIYLLRNFTRISYTIETPSDFPLQKRVEAMRSALAAFGEPESWQTGEKVFAREKIR